MTPDGPHTYPKRVLLAVSGLTPQVVTETLYAIIQREPPFVPTEVHIITTAEGAARSRLALLSEEPGWFRRLSQDFNLPPITFDDDRIHVLSDGAGRALDDIRTPDDNRRAANEITRVVRELTTDDESALHVSIAGGRKTMGYYLGYALSLFGRAQDRLSHVLVPEPFESTWDFFYPTPHERIIQTRDGKLADCRAARVTLAEIPFVRLREGLPRRLLTGQASLTEVVAAAQRALRPPRLVLDLGRKTAQADDVPLDLSATEYAVLLWLAERAHREYPPVSWQEADTARAFLRVAGRVMDRSSAEYGRCARAVKERIASSELLKTYFEPHKSRVNAAIETALGATAARRYLIQRSGHRGKSGYFLPLAPGQIVFQPLSGTAASLPQPDESPNTLRSSTE